MKDSKKTILTLRVCSKDFARLMKGEIIYELREMKPFRENRLLEKEGGFKQFEEIHIKNGYQSNAPLAIYKFGEIQTIQTDEKTYFKIIFGALKSIEYYHPKNKNYSRN